MVKLSTLAICLAACGPTAGGADPGGDDDDQGAADAGSDPVDAPPDDEFDDPEGCTDALPLTASLPPDILLVVDRSGSMDGAWDPVTTAVEQVVVNLPSVTWGLSFFPTSTDGADPCQVDPVAVPMPATAGQVSTAIDGTGPYGLTPTSQAVKMAGNYLASLTDDKPRYVMLVTDGIPNCAPQPNCMCPPGFTKNGADQCVKDNAGPYDYYSCDITGDLSINATYWAIDALRVAGINTFVFGLPTGGYTDFALNVLAPAGGEAKADPPYYYPASSPAELQGLLEDLSTGLVACSFQLPADLPLSDLLGIEIDDVNVPRDPNHVNGWDLDGTGTMVRVYGSWCDLVQHGAGIAAEFICPPPP